MFHNNFENTLECWIIRVGGGNHRGVLLCTIWGKDVVNKCEMESVAHGTLVYLPFHSQLAVFKTTPGDQNVRPLPLPHIFFNKAKLLNAL